MCRKVPGDRMCADKNCMGHYDYLYSEYCPNCGKQTIEANDD